MTLKAAASRTTRQKAQRKPFILAVGGAALAVALVGGIGAWQRADHRTSTSAVEQVPPVVVAAPPAVVAAPAARVGAADDFLTVTIVDSEEQKLRLEQGLVVNQVVLVAATDEEANRIMQAYGGYQGYEGSLAQAVKFNDLRTPADGARGACGTTIAPAFC